MILVSQLLSLYFLAKARQCAINRRGWTKQEPAQLLKEKRLHTINTALYKKVIVVVRTAVVLKRIIPNAQIESSRNICTDYFFGLWILFLNSQELITLDEANTQLAVWEK